MNLNEKPIRTGITFLVLLFVAGVLLLFGGHDPIAMSMEKKEGLLSAEQIKLSFENIGGRLIKENVQESQEVKQGDILLVLDSVDIDLAMERLETQISQMDAKISQLNGSIQIGYAKTATNESQAYRQIEQQKMALDAARATYENQQLTYNRRKALAVSGAISQSELDSAQTALNVAAANLGQQERLLEKLLSGASSTEKDQVFTHGDASNIYLPEFAQQRQELNNNQFNVQDLIQQKQYLMVQLKEYQVKKERLTLRAPEAGKVLKILAKQGEMVAANAPVILLESKRYYYDIYLDEQQAASLQTGDEIVGSAIATGKPVQGIIRFITAAPGFADLKMSREKGQGDLAAFQVRIYVTPQANLQPGMTIEVKKNAFLKR